MDISFKITEEKTIENTRMKLNSNIPDSDIFLKKKRGKESHSEKVKTRKVN